jgi:hypothetical protein
VREEREEHGQHRRTGAQATGEPGMRRAPQGLGPPPCRPAASAPVWAKCTAAARRVGGGRGRGGAGLELARRGERVEQPPPPPHPPTTTTTITSSRTSARSTAQC